MVKVEQLEGIAGFGGPHLKSEGTVNVASLSEGDRNAVEALFVRGKQQPATAPAHPDQLRYRLTRSTSTGTETVEALESEVPQAVKASVSAKLE